VLYLYGYKTINGGVGMGNKDDMMLGLIIGILIFLTIVVSAIAIKIGV
jgi:hypothetical protein